MDTWATSSLTPQIAGKWRTDPDLFARVFPMDLRPQSHEIIRTWLFSTIVRAHTGHGSTPWKHAAISGWILDPDRKKMSKSRGNVVTPGDLLARHGSDAVRYWAASGRPGTDTAFDVGQMRIGRRLATKLLNVGRFVLGLGGAEAGGTEGDTAGGTEAAAVTEPLDRALLAALASTVDEATAAFDAYDYARALDRTEHLFRRFCDDYVELVKARAYGDHGDTVAMESARAALRTALDVLLRLFAPVLPFVTEEVWSWWRDGSVHRAAWPSADELRRYAGDEALLGTASEAIAAVRGAKSRAKLSMRAEVARVTVSAPRAVLDRFALAEGDVRAAGRVAAVELREERGPLRLDADFQRGGPPQGTGGIRMAGR